jgi:phosphoribosylaminoimidazole-succinocarboxamide synthase
LLTYFVQNLKGIFTFSGGHYLDHNLINLCERIRNGYDMKNRKMLYEGKAKTIFEGPVKGTAIQYFKDDTTAFNKQKHALIEGKGVLNNMISSFIMERLESCGIATHYVKRLNMREQLVKLVDIIPLEVVVRRKAYGSLCKRYNIEEGSTLDEPLVEFFLKDDTLGDPLISPEAAIVLGFCEEEDLEQIHNLALRITDILSGLFTAIGLDLADIKYEFGVTKFIEDLDIFPELVLADEISPDNCRLRDLKTGEAFDKDLFRLNTGDLAAGYTEVAKRLNILPQINKSEPEELATVTHLQDVMASALKKRKSKNSANARTPSSKKTK